jgi:type II secretory pathway pseudopilin PulG
MDVRGRAKYEIVVVVIVVLLAIAVAIGLYAGRSKVHNDKLVINELSAIRSAVTLYADVNKAMPPNLETLTKSTYDVAGANRPYLDSIKTNAEGKLVDPFGKPFVYDAKRGLVSSTSPGYEKW